MYAAMRSTSGVSTKAHCTRIGFASAQEEHVASSNQLVCARTVENRAGVYHRAYLEGHACREVRLDGTRNDVGRRALCGDNHVYAYGTCQLCDTCDGQFDFFSGCHNQVAELIYNHHDIGHEAMPVFGVELSVLELGVVFLDISCARFLQQVIACVHFLAQAFQSGHYFLYICDDRFVLLFRDSCKEVVFDGRIDTEFNLFGVHHDKFQFRGMFLI